MANADVSLMPVVGYEPVYRLVGGGAGFYKHESFSAGLDANTNGDKVYQAHSRAEKVFSWGSIKELSGIKNGFEPYFGEGGETRVDAFQRKWGMFGDIRSELSVRLGDYQSVGTFHTLRFAKQVDGTDQTASGVGAFYQRDSRDVPENPSSGSLLRVDLTYYPYSLSNGRELNFGQIEGQYAFYQSILKDWIPKTVFAAKISAGYTIGTPNPLYEFRLGGANKLRGYYENRFRGAYYFSEQNELRFPLWRIVSGCLFMDVGDATNTTFTSTKITYGVGLRGALPPDWISRVRIDFGIGHDQSGVFADFGHTF